MATYFRKCVAFILCLVAPCGIAVAQPRQLAPEKIPVQVQIVMSRYQNDRLVSTMPFTLIIATSTRGNIRTGTTVPVVSSSPATGFNYTSIGTQIDCGVFLDNGKFRVELSINDTWIIDEDSATAKPGTARSLVSPPVMRNFVFSNAFLLKDGETRQFVSAPDRTAGDVTKIDVTLISDK